MATGTGRGNHKVILLGEHAVVYGHPALGAALSDGITVGVTVSDETTITGIPDDPTVREALAAVAAAARIEQPVSAVIETSLPNGAGLGSSAALCVAHARALLDLAGRPADTRTVLKLADAGERVFHGSPSGIDAWIAATGAPALYRKGGEPETLPLGKDLHVAVLVDPGRTPTMTTVTGVKKRFDADRTGIGKLFEEIEALVLEAREALASGDASRLGRLMNRNHEILGELGVSTDGLDRLRDLALEKGALGAKLTGGGGGGAVIALAGSAGDAARIVECSKSVAEAAFVTTLSVTGTDRRHEP